MGCSGWFYWHWKGRFYPEEKGTHQWFAHYRKRFNTVELNAPFYRWPKSANVRQWKRQATRNFKYCVKVNRYITHERRFEGVKTMLNEFYRIAEWLDSHMGCFLFQCPPSFRFTAGHLKTILRLLDAQHRNVVEFRHRSWWNKDVFKAFREHDLIFCSVSAPRLPDELIKTTNDIYVRMHGSERWYRHEYTRTELHTWADRIRDSNAETTWAFFNNDFGAHAPRNARQLRLLLKRCNLAGKQK